MKYSKIFQYAYLVFAALFIYDGIGKWNHGTNSAYVSFGLAALAIFMYFFRRKFAKKYDNTNNSK
ncbi:hypothetical protein QLS71_010405 [Mariniflexile litorale]|uniref:LPXTG-motif cell wall-anchored protein n=1 Tax=Mariniflexile litorale TaxID=3045158 RepID=A0AAU7EBT6_9FLAO|nr:hypothetical protein [Mariniflexile sp. KMM 9835]MDQ8212472.1 hypothetical protein [Mariniflexile sp. KMM 9835]